MKVFNDPIEFRDHNLKVRESGRQIGLFATLGAVHRGHLSLVDRARAENDYVVSSVFVNPLMFNGGTEEADAYPYDPTGDLEKLEGKGVDAVLVPSREAVYPPGYVTRVTVPDLEGRYEAARMPNMLSGISTICTKLFQLCVPHRWYFGEKDAQQLALVKQVSKDLNWPTEIVPCPSIREEDGLPFSSRNKLMSPEERALAGCVVDAIRAAKALYDTGERGADALAAAAARAVEATAAKLDYAALVDRNSFQDLTEATDEALLVVAADLGRLRVLDNHRLSRPLPPEVAARAN
ncbi:pantoate--beta-alanine ligase [Streptomyces eurythermus]|uniref:pantoate--beta-alanine ligase n=1 Tax=Streptomyces eurythermus TaxID=42237 RepID=UPI0033F2229A